MFPLLCLSQYFASKPFLPTKFLSSSSSSFSSASHLILKTLTPSNLIKLGITPSIKTLNLFLSLLVKSQKHNLLLHLFSQISANSIKTNSKTCFLVARSLLRSHHFKEAREIVSHCKRFDFVPRKGIFDSIIQCLCIEDKGPENAFSVLNQCIEDYGIFPSFHCFRSLVLKFSSKGNMGRAMEVLEVMRGETDGYPIDNFICSSIISGFCRIGKPELGLGFYEEVKKGDGFSPNLVTCTAVVEGLCRIGRMDEACELVKAMEEKGIALDEVLYSSLICGCFKNGILMEAFRKHRLMLESGMVPDVVSYTNLIDGFCKEGNVEKVIGVLNAMEKNGLKPKLITYTVLLQGFCKRGKMEEAFCVLKRMEELGLVLDEFVYAILINGLCKRGDLDQVFSLLEEMKRKGIQIGSVTYNTVINCLSKAGDTHKVDEISRSYVGDNFTFSILLHRYSKEMDVDGVIETKRRLEEAGICLDVVTFNTLIKSLFMIGMSEDACTLFKEMPDKGVVANSVTYCTMIDGLCKKGMMKKALEIFEEYRTALTLSEATCHVCIIRGLCKEHMTEMAIDVFKELAEKNLVSEPDSYRKLIKAQFRDGNGEGVLKFVHSIDTLETELLTSVCNDALIYLCKRNSFTAALATCIFMKRRRLSITSKSYYVLLKGLICSENKLITELLMCDCIKVNGPFGPRMENVLSLYLCKKNLEEAMRFLADKNKKDIYVSVLTTAVHALKKEGRSLDALEFLMEAEENGAALDVVVYAIVVDGLCKEGHLEKALDLCSRMRGKGIHPNCVVYNSIINGLCQQGCLVEAMRIFDFMEAKCLFPTVITYATLIGALSREGFVEDAEQLFKRMVLKGITPDTRIYNSLIQGHCSFGLIEKALKILMELEESGLQADVVTISSVISGYCQKGDIQDAYGFFIEYKRRGFLPDFLGFLSLIEGLFTKRRMKEARDVLSEMLQCTEVVDLINRVSNEHNVESVISLLNLFGEQGRIREAICILSEVGSEAFTSWRSKNSSRHKHLKQLEKIISLDTIEKEEDTTKRGNSSLALKIPRHESLHMAAEVADMSDGLCKFSEKDSSVGDYEFMLGKSLNYNFDTYYSIIASLCSKGELQKANTVVKTMIMDLGEYC